MNIWLIISAKTYEFARNILHTKHYVPKGFCWCKNLNFFGEKWMDEAVDHEMELLSFGLIGIKCK